LKRERKIFREKKGGQGIDKFKPFNGARLVKREKGEGKRRGGKSNDLLFNVGENF
jgi:hypothetical protein